MNYISEAWVLEEEEKRTRLEKQLNQILEGLKAIIRNLRYWTGNNIVKKSLGKISLVTPGVMDLKDKSLRQRGLELRLEEGTEQGTSKREDKARTWKQMEQLT